MQSAVALHRLLVYLFVRCAHSSDIDYNRLENQFHISVHSCVIRYLYCIQLFQKTLTSVKARTTRARNCGSPVFTQHAIHSPEYEPNETSKERDQVTLIHMRSRPAQQLNKLEVPSCVAIFVLCFSRVSLSCNSCAQ